MEKAETIKKAYIDFILTNGHEPASIFTFTKKLKIKEDDFYERYNSFVQIENIIWKGYFEEAKMISEKEKIYASYSVREKFLSFYFTWIDVLKSNRSFILKAYEKLEKPIYYKKNLAYSGFKQSYLNFANELLKEGYETSEVENRAIPQLMSLYPDIFWTKTLFILDFWMNDDSPSFEKTDTAIEKIVNTAFDFISKSPLDTLFDLGKFLYQNKK